MTNTPTKPKRKRVTKKDIYEKHLAEITAAIPDLPADIARRIAKERANGERPTAKQKRERKAQIEALKKGPPSPWPPSEMLLMELRQSADAPTSPRISKQPDGSFVARVIIAGKAHKVMTLPDGRTAERIARVARAAAWTLFGQGERPGIADFAATAAVSANYEIGLKRRPGRNAALVHVTSQDIVDRVAGIVGAEAPRLPEPPQVPLNADAARQLGGLAVLAGSILRPYYLRSPGITDDLWSMNWSEPRTSTRSIIDTAVGQYKKRATEAYREAGLEVPKEAIEEAAKSFEKKLEEAAQSPV